ncbi:alginate biosynthesis protein AlgA [Pseudomonas sp. SCT]|uniref:mannose-1-phosphate guanylyltransferase/mannose-6-phosphate isomerase n=1 Tax=Pseudomonas sp. (strain SCT) TaxID=412955 RepID=UPI000EE0445B|nr:mannose-1-phosphate guanylyltransferase/mannose-6-phosphate isomerase [Pseudomonas sp. SCT]GCA55486.1 alginate biosynthesis protein AlgA [Pseudomonas sp. SCT]
MKLIPVIMSGGVGSRLWPVSRETHPKPFMALPDGQNLIQKTFIRAAALDNVVEIMTVTNRDLFFKTEDEYRLVGGVASPLSYILEPFGRNTAAAVAIAAVQLEEIYGPEAQMLVLPADHLIARQSEFLQAVQQAQILAADGYLVTFGIHPEYPETGFGYIEADHASPLLGGLKVLRYVEKPDAAAAKGYVTAGNYFWNSGMFCFQVGTVLNQLQQHSPDVLQHVRNAFAHAHSTQGEKHRCLRLDTETFADVPDISIDCALMERSDVVATVPCELGWSDIGSWSAVSQLVDANPDGNRCMGEVLAYRSSNNYVQSTERLTALVGVHDLIIVDTPDAILVSHKNCTQDVKHIVSQLKKNGHNVHQSHQTVYRPWGTYTTLEEGERFKIKRIVVKPKASLSLQMHHHRSEHWIVVSGMARVINDSVELLLDTNESTFIRAGHNHRLENPGVIDLILIEVQSGDYLGEDDIVRLEDRYGRT